MHNTKGYTDFNIFSIEQQLRESVYELQQKTDALERVQEELSEMRQTLYDTKITLENDRRVTSELRMQLSAAIGVVNRLEDEKMRTHIEYVQMQINYESMLKERDSLISQMKASKMQHMKAEMKIHAMENKIRTMETKNKNLEESLSMLKSDTLKMITTADSGIAKLKTEHQRLQRSCEEIVMLNKRLQVVGLCAHAIHQRDKMEIQKLRCTLASLTISNEAACAYNTAPHPEIRRLCEKLRALIDRLRSTEVAQIDENSGCS